MAEMQEPYPNGTSEQPGRLKIAVNVLGAVTSLALLAGTAIWGYKMVVRDVSGVPVIKAAAGPARVQPEDPGGEPAQHQGLSVNEIAAGNAAGDPAERLILAPPPLDLSLEEAELAAMRAGGAGAGTDDASAAETSAPGAASEEIDSARRAEIDKLAADIAASVSSPDDGETDTSGAATPAQDNATQAKGGLARSLRPRLRPDSLADGPEVVTRASARAAEVRDIDPDTIAAGTRLAQLGAFASRAVAEERWTVLAERFDGYLADKSRVIQKATSGGRTFYRLRAMGFDGLDHARRFCSALVEQDADCIPVVVR
jgi:hypothetical protein